MSSNVKVTFLYCSCHKGHMRIILTNNITAQFTRSNQIQTDIFFRQCAIMVIKIQKNMTFMNLNMQEIESFRLPVKMIDRWDFSQFKASHDFRWSGIWNTRHTDYGYDTFTMVFHSLWSLTVCYWMRKSCIQQDTGFVKAWW